MPVDTTTILSQKPNWILVTEPVIGTNDPTQDSTVDPVTGLVSTTVAGVANRCSAQLWGLIKELCMIIEHEHDPDGSHHITGSQIVNGTIEAYHLHTANSPNPGDVLGWNGTLLEWFTYDPTRIWDSDTEIGVVDAAPAHWYGNIDGNERLYVTDSLFRLRTQDFSIFPTTGTSNPIYIRREAGDMAFDIDTGHKYSFRIGGTEIWFADDNGPSFSTYQDLAEPFKAKELFEHGTPVALGKDGYLYKATEYTSDFVGFINYDKCVYLGPREKTWQETLEKYGMLPVTIIGKLWLPCQYKVDIGERVILEAGELRPSHNGKGWLVCEIEENRVRILFK